MFRVSENSTWTEDYVSSGKSKFFCLGSPGTNFWNENSILSLKIEGQGGDGKDLLLLLLFPGFRAVVLNHPDSGILNIFPHVMVLTIHKIIFVVIF